MPPYSQPESSFPAEPTLIDVLNLFKKGIFSELNCHHVGTIQSFDSTNQTARATVNYKQTILQPNAQGVYQQVLIDYPILADCPVVFLGGGSSHLTFPVAQGDECLVLFNDRDFDNWYSGASTGQPATPRKHSFSDGIIMVGLRSLGNIIQNFDTARAVLRHGNAYVGVGAQLVKVGNDQYTLNELLQELISDVRNLVDATAGLTVICSGGGMASSTPINAAAISAAGSQLAATATKIEGLLE